MPMYLGSNYISDIGVLFDSGSSGGLSDCIEAVNFIDYNGTILHSYTASEAQALTALPSNPSHSGLTAQGWNWTLAEIKAQLTAMPDAPVWVGQMYITDDGKTRLYCHFETGRLAPYLGLGVNGTVVVDWGDGSSTDALTGTSLTTAVHAQHIYGAAGDYTITLTVSSGSFEFFGVSNTSHILKRDTGITANANLVYANAIQRVELGANASIGNFAFYNCYSLVSITIPDSVTTISDHAFGSCRSLASITIPDSVTTIGNNVFSTCCCLASITIPDSVTTIGSSAFSLCYSLASITIPDGVTTIGNNAFSNCYSLASITIPDSVTTINNNAFSSCRSLASITIPDSVTAINNNAFSTCCSLASITIPDGVTTIGSNAFQNCYGMAEYHLLPTTPPTLSDTNAFTNIQSDCVIYVPYSSDHSVLEAYQTATNWSTYASYMQEEPQ